MPSIAKQFEKEARSLIDNALGDFAKLITISPETIAYIGSQLQDGKKMTKDQILKEIEKREKKNNKNIEIIFTASTMDDAQEMIIEANTSEVILAAKAEQGGGSGTIPPAEAKETSDPKAKNEVKAIKVDANADVTKIVALAEDIAEKKEPTSVQLVKSYTAMVNAGALPQAPMAVTAGYKAQQETFKAMKEDGFKGMRLASLEKAKAFAINREDQLQPEEQKPIVMLVPYAGHPQFSMRLAS